MGKVKNISMWLVHWAHGVGGDEVGSRLAPAAKSENRVIFNVVNQDNGMFTQYFVLFSRVLKQEPIGTMMKE